LAEGGRVVWSELRSPVTPLEQRRAARQARDFAAILQAEMARLAS
jgi:hypothetical protein